MLWARNLLFLGLVGGGLVVLGLKLMPPRKPDRLSDYESAADRDKELTATVARVDAAFRDPRTANGIQPAPPAPELQQARRIALGLMGTVPSLEEIRQLEALPPGQRAAWYLDHVLEDTRFHDYLAERLARAYVGTEDGPFLLFRRRRFVTWLSEQVATNRPYDQLVRELIAGDGVWTDHPSTNFLTVTAQQDKGNAPNPVRLAGRVTRAFLGVRIDCAECHNHPFAPWKQTDFQGLSAFFGQTKLGFRGIQDGEGEYTVEDKKKELETVVAAKVPFSEDLLPRDGERRDRLAAWVTHPKNPYFARATVNRVWALMTGKPLVEPVDNLDIEGPLPAPLTILADDFSAHGYDLRRLIRIIARTQVFRLDSASPNDVGESEERLWAVFPMSRLRPEQVAGSVIQAGVLSTVNAESHIAARLVRQTQQSQFIQRYGDTGEDEFEGRGGTIPQRLLMMNGELVRERIKEGPFNIPTRVAVLAPDDPKAVEVAYLAVLSRRPTPAEADHFEKLLQDKSVSRARRLEDLFWALINSTEFSWNH
ncbi:MAG TPA: DUF1549 domain-containing protein [Gemmataceae bacterium]|nr:DUF1549 domain-containing protein [Gemmataceae bacterium]